MGGRGGSGSGSVGGGRPANLPELEGSAKQIEWAKSIRQAAYDDLDEIEKALKNGDKIVSEYRYFEGKGRKNTGFDARMTEPVRDSRGKFIKGEDGKAIRRPKADMKSIQAVRKDMNAYFMSKEGRKAGNIIDKMKDDGIEKMLERVAKKKYPDRKSLYKL